MADDSGCLRMERLLDRVRRATMSGDFASLPALAAEAEAGIAALGAGHDIAAAQRLQAMARRNAACLDAALRGLRAARRRLTDIGSAQAGIRTYDGSGATLRLGTAGGSLAQRL